MDGYLEKLGRVYNIKELNTVNSGGNLRKWVGWLSNNRKVYIKTASRNSTHWNYECEAECVVSRLAIMLGLANVVQYVLDNLSIGNNSYKVCVSEDFVCGNTYNTLNSLIPNITSYQGVAKYNMVLTAFPHLRTQLDNILVFDAIILNKDRHLRNLGVLNGSIMPLFDNGSSLFYNCTVSYIEKILRTTLDLQPCKPFFNTYKNQLSLVAYCSLQPVHRTDVYRLVNQYFSGSRAKLINKLLIMRLERFNLLCV